MSPQRKVGKSRLQQLLSTDFSSGNVDNFRFSPVDHFEIICTFGSVDLVKNDQDRKLFDGQWFRSITLNMYWLWIQNGRCLGLPWTHFSTTQYSRA